MGDLKPLGSEKLKGDDKLKRILELTYYGQKNNNINESTSQKAEVIKETANGVYGIIKEKDGYYVKRGLNESSLDYIGGLFMKNKNKFSSYAEALKRLELLRSQDLQEEKKFVLNTGKPKSEAPVSAPAVPDAPAPSAPTASDAPPAPASDAPDGSSLSDGSNFGPDDMSSADSAPSDDSSMDDDMPMGDDSEGPSHMKEVQRLCGKLGQAIREVQEDMESDDVKYVINMILSAVDIQKLSEEDKEAIVEKFEPEDEGGMSSEEPSGEEAPEEGGEDFDGMPTPPSGESDMDETMDTLENLVNTNFNHEDEQSSDMDEYFYLYDKDDKGASDFDDEPTSMPSYRSVNDDDKPNRLTTSPNMNNVWYDDKDQAYNDFDGMDYDEEDFDDHDSYMGKHSDSIGDLRYKPDFDMHKPIKVRTLRKNNNFDISPELTEINEAINTTLSKYFE